MKSLIGTLSEDRVSAEIEAHINEFYNYLSKEKKLKEKTCSEHCENTMWYIDYYMHFNSLEDLKKISSESIHRFLLECFIPKITTSKTSVKSEITSLNRYLKYLVSKELISKETLEAYKDIVKNKEIYIKYVDEYLNVDNFHFLL